MGKNTGANTSRNLSGNYSQKLLYHAKQSVTDALKTTSDNIIQKAAEATGEQTGKEISNKITKISKKLQQKNSKTTFWGGFL